MKYTYALTIKDTTNEQELLVIKATGVSRNQENCLKTIRREITRTIRNILDKQNGHSNNT